MSNVEQTLSIIKPDAVERNLENEIKEMFKNKGFSILKEKKIQIETTEAENFYKVHENKPAYSDPKETMMAPVKVAKSTINFGLYFSSV